MCNYLNINILSNCLIINALDNWLITNKLCKSLKFLFFEYWK